MSLGEDLEETISLIIEAQQSSLLKKIEKENNWDLRKIMSDSKRGRGRPRKDKQTYSSGKTSSQRKENDEKKISFKNGKSIKSK